MQISFAEVGTNGGAKRIQILNLIQQKNIINYQCSAASILSLSSNVDAETLQPSMTKKHLVS